MLDKIPGRIGEWYRDRAAQHLKEAHPTELGKARMKVNEKVRIFPELPIPELNPDGVFLEGVHGAVFESKLKLPSHVEFEHEMAVYALFFEKSTGKNVDFSIVAYTDYPQGRNLFSAYRPILDSAVGSVTKNLERFLNLVEYSEGSPRRRSAREFGLKDQEKDRTQLRFVEGVSCSSLRSARAQSKATMQHLQVPTAMLP